MKIITGNDLKSGAVTWWTGKGWSLAVNDAVDVADAAPVIAAEEAARRVNGAYVIDAEQTADGIRPAHIKERIRALGPTVRLDLSLDPTATPDRVL
jgi:hypothetical protein